MFKWRKNRKHSHFYYFFNLFCKKRIVKMLSGSKIVIYEYRFCNILLWRKRFVFPNAKAIDGGGGLQFQLSESFLNQAYLNEKLPPLIRGLDESSKEVVYKIIHRLRETYSDSFHICKSLDSNEKRVLKDIKENFINRIYKINENLYFYDGYYLPSADFEISVFYHKHSLSALSNLEALKHKDILDIGAYIGDSALVLSNFTLKKVHSFEIDAKNFSILQKTIALNLNDKIIAHNLALGKESGITNVSLGGIGSKIEASAAQTANKNVTSQMREISATNSPQKPLSTAPLLDKSSLENKTNHSIKAQINVSTLDSFVEQHKIEVGFIKVDIEGAEMDFLEGAKNTICTQKPAMLLSIYHSARDFFEIKPLIESWNLGYTFKIIKPIDTTIATECALFCEIIN